MQSIKLIIEEYRKTKNFKKLGESSKELLEKGGLMKLPMGSYWTWMHIDWLNKALEEKVLKENIYGQFIPIADIWTTTETVGKRGKSETKKEVEKLSFARFDGFVERYNKFCYAKEMELQQRADFINE